MSWDHLSAVCRHPLPKGNKHVGQEKVAKVLLYYAELSDERGYAFPSQGAISEELDLTIRDVQHAQKCLEAQGFISKVRKHVKGHRGTTFRLNQGTAGVPDYDAEQFEQRSVSDGEFSDRPGDGHHDGCSGGPNSGDVPSTTEIQNHKVTELILDHSEISERRHDRPMITSAVVSAAKRFKNSASNAPGSDWQRLYAGVENEILLSVPAGSTRDEIENLAFDAFIAHAEK